MTYERSLARGRRYRWRFATTAGDFESSLRLRQDVFRNGTGDDRDNHDTSCRHVLIENTASGALVASFRFLPLASGCDVASCYSARHYDLSRLAAYPDSLLELGRFCMCPAMGDPDILRLAWGILTRYVETNRIGMLFGCTSFKGTDPERYGDVFALLRDRHLAPAQWRPTQKAPTVAAFPAPCSGVPDRKRALHRMPPLLRTYLSMGGWVSDHAVIDHDLDTVHVFTGLETRNVPPARARALRALAVS